MILKKSLALYYTVSPSWQDPVGLAKAILGFRFGKYQKEWFIGEGDALRIPLRVRRDYTKNQ